MKHPCLLQHAQGNDYPGWISKVQMTLIVDVPSDLLKTININK